MKVFFDTNVYVAEALLGKSAEAMLGATQEATWRILVSEYVLDEAERVLGEYLGFSKRLARLTRRRCIRRAIPVEESVSRHEVSGNSDDSPVLRAALGAGADYLVTNDAHLLGLDPYESLRIMSMTAYHQLLVNEGLLR